MKHGDGASLASLQERLTRTSACHRSNSETGTKSPDNAHFYWTTYDQEESVAEPVPAIVAAFPEADKAFARWCWGAANRDA